MAVLSLVTALNLSGCEYVHTNRNLATTIKASSELNPDLNGRASPLVISIYQLKDKLAFKSLSYEQLSRNPYKNLKSSLIDYTNLEIQPGQQRKIERKMNTKTLYLGIVAAYRKLSESTWRKIVEIPKGTRPLKLQIYLAKQQLNTKVS